MKRGSSIPSCSLRVTPFGGRLPKGNPIELDLPRGELIKHEEVTLIWRGVLVHGRQTVAKLYRRGMLVRCHGLVTFFRVQREFDGLSQLEKLGIPCSIPLFWSHGHFGPYGWGEMLVTELVDQSQTLRDLLSAPHEVGRGLDLSPLFADMARMHASGLHHGMLRTRNILVKNYPEQPLFALIDLPRFHLFPGDIKGQRMARYDVMSLCEGLLPYFPEDTVRSWLSVYGIPEPEMGEFLGALKRFESTPSLRKAYAWEFDIRYAMARFLTSRPAIQRTADSEDRDGRPTTAESSE
jgi:tRNA A-37 threonylcarbamoyl transferase component Bud32